ncbi:MAG: hypothetical protein UW94_C0013G0013 [Parcubacteria group bacterium GW2011_GWA2_45_14]|nr:MAG: hypothetical protein UW94_C0013G0013 [Parcubacteria group bacterium GW2011_GWA2_45_14]
MNYTKTFKDINKADVAIAGGKGASLGEMTQAGIQVPHGFVILAPAFDEFLRITDLNVELDSILDQVHHEVMHEVDDASEKIKALILGKEIPEYMAAEIVAAFEKLDAEFVAVRSSATSEDSAAAAWAGQLDTYLNTEKDNLLENVKKCWASLFTPRAIFYRFEKGLHGTPISVAVVVQRMIQSEISGIAFSVHPVTQDYDQLIIEAGFGLGEAIVSGSITPDSYVVEKEPRRIIDINVATQNKGLYRISTGGNEWIDIPEPKASSQVLSEAQILEFANLIMIIENHYGFPCDIEWAYEDGKFYIVQSRPITTLVNEKHNDLNRFTNKNRSLEHADGLPVYFEMTMTGFTDRLRNNNLSSYEIGISHFIKDEVDYISLIQDQNKIGSAIIKDFLNNPSSINNLYKEWVIGYEKMLDRSSVVFDYDLNKFSDKKLLSLSEDIYSFYRKEVSMPGFTDGFMFYAEKRLNDLIMEYCDINKLKNFTEIFTTLTASTEPSFFNEKESDLSRASDTESKNSLLKKYAWLNSSYSGYKPYTKENLDNDLKDVKDPALAEKQLSDNKLAKQDLINKHKFNDEILAIVKLTDLFIKWQDQRKVYTLSYVALRSKILHEIAQRFKFDIKLLEYALTEELPLVLDKSFSIDVLKNRRDSGVLFIHKNGKLQETIVGEESESFVAKLQGTENNGASEISGTIASRGKVIGKVRIVMTAKNINDVEDGEILVAPMTRPEHLVGMKKAAAIVTDDGGITCHAAIVSRELGKPCIIGTKNATKILKNDDLVEVDAENGVVKIIRN